MPNTNLCVCVCDTYTCVLPTAPAPRRRSLATPSERKWKCQGNAICVVAWDERLSVQPIAHDKEKLVEGHALHAHSAPGAHVDARQEAAVRGGNLTLTPWIRKACKVIVGLVIR